jgi:excisionase family DNA binding protein
MTTADQERAPLIDVPTAAARLGIGIGTLRKKISAGVIPAYRIGGPGTQIRLDPVELDQWLRTPEGNAPGGGE